MPVVPGLYLPPPSPFVSKQSPGTPVNWGDPLASGLQLCWAFNEGSGNYIAEVARGSNAYGLNFGPHTATGTGAQIPNWTTHEHAAGLRVYFEDAQMLRPAVQYGPPLRLKNGFTIEMFFRSLATDLTNQYGLFEIGCQTGKIAELVIGVGVANKPYIYGDAYATPSQVVWTDFQASNPYSTHADLPNHIVFTWVGQEASLYGNGLLLANFKAGDRPSTIIPFANEETQNYYVAVGYTTNFQHGSSEGVLYKASLYNVALGPAAVMALASNPMRVLLAAEIPGDFTPPGGVEGPPGSGGGGPDPDPYPGGVPGMPYTDGSAGKNIFIYYKHNWEWAADPLDVTRHDSYELDFNWVRWKFLRRMWVAGVGSAPIILQIYVDERLRYTKPFTLSPSSGSGWKRTAILLPPNLKGNLFRFVMTSATPFKIFESQSDIEWKPLSGDRGYQRHPLQLNRAG